jgi:hypothetical protein
MTTKLKIAALALALALLVFAPPFAQPSLADRGTGPLVGTWRMTSLEVGPGGDLQPVPYSGQIIFTKAGTMSVQAMNPDANAPDTPYTRNGYEAFYGTVTVDQAAGTFNVTVESSLVRDLIGQNLTRVYEVRGDTLVLTPPDPAEGWRATYERL